MRSRRFLRMIISVARTHTFTKSSRIPENWVESRAENRDCCHDFAMIVLWALTPEELNIKNCLCLSTCFWNNTSGPQTPHYMPCPCMVCLAREAALSMAKSATEHRSSSVIFIWSLRDISRFTPWERGTRKGRRWSRDWMRERRRAGGRSNIPDVTENPFSWKYWLGEEIIKETSMWIQDNIIVFLLAVYLKLPHRTIIIRHLFNFPSRQ